MKRVLFLKALACSLLTLSLAAHAQEKGYWRAASQTARSITGDVSLADEKISINFYMVTMSKIRALEPGEVSAVFDADTSTNPTIGPAGTQVQIIGSGISAVHEVAEELPGRGIEAHDLPAQSVEIPNGNVQIAVRADDEALRTIRRVPGRAEGERVVAGWHQVAEPAARFFIELNQPAWQSGSEPVAEIPKVSYE